MTLPDECMAQMMGRSTRGFYLSFHPEMAFFRNLGVNPRDSSCGVLIVRLLAIP